MRAIVTYLAWSVGRSVCDDREPYTGCTPAETVRGERRVTGGGGGLEGPLSGDVATSAMHQMRGFAPPPPPVDVVGLVTSRAPTSGCRSRSRDARRTQEKALRASTSSRERRSASNVEFAAAAAAGDVDVG